MTVFQEENHKLPVNKEDKKKQPDEAKLIEFAQNGNNEAFGQLIRLHQQRLFRFVYGLLGTFDTAEDIVQEAFIKAYQGLDTFRPGNPFYPWLSRIARNLAFNHYHREERKESLDNLEEKGFDPESLDLGPMDRLMNEQNQKRFYQAVVALPATYRAVFVMRHFEDMNYTEIASYLKIPPGTVDSRLYRARKMLMEKLRDLL